jgi:hypothetical protein
VREAATHAAKLHPNTPFRVVYEAEPTWEEGFTYREALICLQGGDRRRTPDDRPQLADFFTCNTCHALVGWSARQPHYEWHQHQEAGR